MPGPRSLLSRPVPLLLSAATATVGLACGAALAQQPYLSCQLDGTPRATIHAAGAAGRALPVQARQVEPGLDGTVAFPGEGSHIDIGPDPALGLPSDQSFTVHMRIRVSPTGFCTPLMCREGDSVNYSFVVGRRPGTVSFEVWSWPRDRAISTRRIDDGRWHEVAGAFDAKAKCIALLVDGAVQSVVPVGASHRPSARPMLRLGNNIGAHQPFPGALAAVRIDRGVPPALARALEVEARFAVLDPQTVDAMFEAWLVRMRTPRPPVAAGREDWNRTAAATRRRLQSALGLLPPPYAPEGFDTREATDFATFSPELPMAVEWGGTLEREGYRLSRLYWQTVRGYFASGFLYRPTGPAAARSRAAVLCPHGHFSDGARHPVIQSRCITLARDGYVVLAVDSVHVTDDPIGLSPLSLMTWNNLRGLELLRGLPEVDPARIGCTGASGGGQQTFYLTGLRTGLAAVVPAVMVCYFEEILRSGGVHCSCNFTPGVMGFADEPLLSACFAPRPQLFLSVTGDWTRNFPERGYPEVQAIYRQFDATDVVGSLQWESQHDYNRDMRNAMYAFFGRHLRGQAQPVAELEPAGLRTEPRNQLVALDRRDVPQDLQAVRREWRQRLGNRKAPGACREALYRRFGGDLLPARVTAQEPVADRQWNGFAARSGAVESRGAIRLPLLRLEPRGERRGVVVLVSGSGKAGILMQQEAMLQGLLQRGRTVVLGDVRYCGELDRARTWREPYGKIFGRDVGVVAADDIAHLLRAVGEWIGVEPGAVTLVALGETGAPALYAVALHGGCGALVVPELGGTYQDEDRQPRIAGILRDGDLPVALALVPASTRVVIGGCRGVDRYRQREGCAIRAGALDVAAVLETAGR